MTIQDKFTEGSAENICERFYTILKMSYFPVAHLLCLYGVCVCTDFLVCYK